MTVILSVALAAALSSCGPLPTDFQRKDVPEIAGQKGVYAVNRGSAFGVHIGMDRNSARAVLLANGRFKFLSRLCTLPGDADRPDFTGTNPTTKDCGGLPELDNYHADNWDEYGNVILTVQDGRVTKIKWWSMHGYPG